MRHLRYDYERLASVLRVLPIWRFRVGRWDLGDLVDSWVWRLLPGEPREKEVALAWGDVLRIPAGYKSGYRYVSGKVEEATAKAFDGILRPGMGVVDGGAHLGYFTLLASRRVGKTGRVYSFEPDPYYVEWLSRNIRENACENVAVFGMALGDKESERVLYCQPGDAGSSLYRVRPIPLISRKVRVVPLDQVLGSLGWPRVDLVKLDVEGAEVAALQGMRETLVRNPGVHLIVEFELRAMRAAGVTPRDFMETLGVLGFRNYRVLVDDMQRDLDLPSQLGELIAMTRKGLFVNILCQRHSKS